MQIFLSGYTDRDINTSNIPCLDGIGTLSINDTDLAVKVAADATDYFLLEFVGDVLNKISKNITKGCVLTVFGELTFKKWTDDEGIYHSKPVVKVLEVQLPAKSKA